MVFDDTLTQITLQTLLLQLAFCFLQIYNGDNMKGNNLFHLQLLQTSYHCIRNPKFRDEILKNCLYSIQICVAQFRCLNWVIYLPNEVEIKFKVYLEPLGRLWAPGFDPLHLHWCHTRRCLSLGGSHSGATDCVSLQTWVRVNGRSCTAWSCYLYFSWWCQVFSGLQTSNTTIMSFLYIHYQIKWHTRWNKLFIVA